MAILGTSFQIGRSALASYQAAISVVGQNIANVGNADYSRQTAGLSALAGGQYGSGISAGLGVSMSSLERHVDDALEARIRDANSTRNAAELEYQYLNQVESLYNELSDQDLSTLLSEMFGAFGQLQTTPDDAGQRNITIAAADSVIDTLHRQRSGLVSQIDEMNSAAEMVTNEVNRLATEIAQLNRTIAIQESDGQTAASALRDRRDALLRDMSEIADIRVNFQNNGIANVYIGSQPLVEFDNARQMEAQRENVNGYEIATIRWEDDNSKVNLTDGKLAGIANTRDQFIAGQIDQLDQLANGLIYEINRLHSQGKGLSGLTSLVSGNDVIDANAALNSDDAGLMFPVQNGTFIVNMRDTVTGQTISRQIEVDLDGVDPDNDTSLTSLANALNDVPGLNASVSSDNRLVLGSDQDTEFWFSEDSSGVVASMGIGTFFSGTNASNIDINRAVRSNPNLIAASASGARGDGDIAGQLSTLADTTSEAFAGQSALDFHTRIITELAVNAAGALNAHEASDTVYQSLQAQRESISGVSLDEEVLNLTMYQRSFQGASRYLSVVEGLSTELLNLLR